MGSTDRAHHRRSPTSTPRNRSRLARLRRPVRDRSSAPPRHRRLRLAARQVRSGARRRRIPPSAPEQRRQRRARPPRLIPRDDTMSPRLRAGLALAATFIAGIAAGILLLPLIHRPPPPRPDPLSVPP